MAKVTFTRRDPRTGGRRVVNRTTAPMRAVLKQVIPPGTDAADALQIEFPYGPVDVKYASIALRYQQIQRPGLQPLLVRSAPQLNVVTFTALIADKRSHGKDNVEDMLDILKDMAASDVDCEFIYGLSALPYRVRITQMDINSRYRNFEGQLTQANVSIQLTEAPDFDPLLGELSAVTPVGTLGTAPAPSGVVTPDEPETPEDPPLGTEIDHLLTRRSNVSTQS
jgi:hypothetical protein